MSVVPCPWCLLYSGYFARARLQGLRPSCNMARENMNRRKAVGALGGLALGTVASAWGRRALAQPVCTLTPEQIEGPFYLDQARIREDISEGKPGVPLRLVLHVLDEPRHHERHGSLPRADRRQVPGDVDDGARRGRLRRRRHHRAPERLALVYFYHGHVA